MRSPSIGLIGVFLLAAAAACSSSSSSDDPGGGEISSQQDVQRFFEAIMPELVEAFTELANQLTLPALTTKGGGESTVPCPEGGSLNVNTLTGQASLDECGARGVVINATLGLFVQPTGPSSYQASFSGIMMVSGTFSGTVEIVQAFVTWSDPATVENTFWEVTVMVSDQIFTVSSATNGGTDNACVWDRGGRANEVRVHVGNSNDFSGIFVELIGGGVTCAIEDENRVLQLPIFGNTFPENRNTVSAGDTFGGLGQALMPIGVGNVVTVTATYQGQLASLNCVVTQEAFETGNPNATAGQAFLDVFGPFQSACPPTITCSFGFEFNTTAQTTPEERFGGSCTPEMPFACDDACLGVCFPTEQLQFAECQPSGECRCTCLDICSF